jgi:hypothetical protein
VSHFHQSATARQFGLREAAQHERDGELVRRTRAGAIPISIPPFQIELSRVTSSNENEVRKGVSRASSSIVTFRHTAPSITNRDQFLLAPRVANVRRRSA